MGFLSNTQLTGMNKVKTEANLACHFEKCQCAPGLESLYACIQMYVSMWNILNNVFFTLLLKRHTVISALRLGNNALFQLSIEGWVVLVSSSCQEGWSMYLCYIPQLFPNETTSPEYLTVALAVVIYFLLPPNLSHFMQKWRSHHGNFASLNLIGRSKT